MTFTEIDTSVPVQPPVGAITCTASGNVYRGQGIYLVGDSLIKSPTDDNQIFFGVAGYNAINSQKVSVYSVGNLIRCKMSSASTLAAGTFVGIIAGGFFSSDATYNSGAVITKAASTNYGDGEVLILGNGYSL